MEREYLPLLREVEVTAFRAGLKVHRLVVYFIVAATFVVVAMCFFGGSSSVPNAAATAAQAQKPVAVAGEIPGGVNFVTALEEMVVRDLWVMHDCYFELARASSDKFFIRWRAHSAAERIKDALPLLEETSPKAGELKRAFIAYQSILRTVWQ